MSDEKPKPEKKPRKMSKKNFALYLRCRDLHGEAGAEKECPHLVAMYKAHLRRRYWWRRSLDAKEGGEA